MRIRICITSKSDDSDSFWFIFNHLHVKILYKPLQINFRCPIFDFIYPISTSYFVFLNIYKIDL